MLLGCIGNLKALTLVHCVQCLTAYLSIVCGMPRSVYAQRLKALHMAEQLEKEWAYFDCDRQ